MALRTLFTNRSLLLLWLVAVVGCSVAAPSRADLHRWWSGFGLVVPHESFPSDCSLCHLGASWNELVPNFAFDHARETGVALHGAHQQAQCLRCHNDRGPVEVFAAKGCNGCHEDVHYGELGSDCSKCHDETQWRVPNARVQHLHSRFPLTGAHLLVGCHQCHPGSRVRNFEPTSPDCTSCHLDEALRTTNPPHAGLGWTERCDRCHTPTHWRPAIVR